MSRPPVRPYPVSPEGSRFARRAWWRGFELGPGVSLRTSAALRPALAQRAGEPRQVLAAVCRAASAALLLHPRLNFFTFWGRLVWAGLPPRVGVVLENGDASCDMVVVRGAHQLAQAEMAGRLARRQGALAAPGLRGRLREAAPTAAYWTERLCGAYARDYARRNAPLFVSLLGLPGVEDLSFTPAHSMALYPGPVGEGRLELKLCFNHQLANARPVGRFLLTLKELLQ